MRKRRAKASKSSHNFVVVRKRSYGAPLQGVKIYFEGRRPANLKKDGSIKFGKHILETLGAKFERFRWIVSESGDSVLTQRGIVRVRTSRELLGRMYREEWDRNRDTKNDIVRRFFAISFPEHFATGVAPVYVPGSLGRILEIAIIPRLSAEDRDAISRFIPEFVASESVGTVNLLKASAQIETLKALSEDLETELSRIHGESWWQTYIRKNILLMQQGYIKAVEKMNVVVGNTKFPDFSLVTHDNFLDILEIKTPQTGILRLDSGRGNYFWDAEMSKAISQVENYIAAVDRNADAIRSYLRDTQNIETKAVRPRGIILAGDARKFVDQKQKDDFRLLSQGIKNVSLVTYDELSTRLRNYIQVLEEFSRPIQGVTPGSGSRDSNNGSTLMSEPS